MFLDRNFAELQNFEQLKNREDGSDFDDFLTQTIGAPSKTIDRADTTAPKRPESIRRPGQWRPAELISRPGGVNKPARPGVNRPAGRALY